MPERAHTSGREASVDSSTHCATMNSPRPIDLLAWSLATLSIREQVKCSSSFPRMQNGKEWARLESDTNAEMPQSTTDRYVGGEFRLWQSDHFHAPVARNSGVCNQQAVLSQSCRPLKSLKRDRLPQAGEARRCCAARSFT